MSELRRKVLQHMAGLNDAGIGAKMPSYEWIVEAEKAQDEGLLVRDGNGERWLTDAGRAALSTPLSCLALGGTNDK